MSMRTIHCIVHPSLPAQGYLNLSVGERPFSIISSVRAELLHALLGKANVELSMTRVKKEVMMKQKEEGDTIRRESSAKP